MKYRNIRVLALAAIFWGCTTACKKESQNIFNMFDVTLTLHTDKSKTIGEYAEVNPGDSVLIDFTIESPTKDMYMVCVFRTGENRPFINIPITDEAHRHSYSDVIRMKADRGVGKTTYRIWALDEEGVYLGDGYKEMTVNVLSDYRYLPNRDLYFPDTTGKVLNCYLSLTTGATYSYTTGQEHASEIDLGIYRKPVYNPGGDLEGYTYHIYSLSADPNPFAPYDISSWTKRATLFAAPEDGGADELRDDLNSGAVIKSEAEDLDINLTHLDMDIEEGKFIYFLTPEGKYGVFMINSYTRDYEGNEFANVSIKIAN